MSNESDLGLETLLDVKLALNVDVDDNLLEACFKIQKKHQFSHDRTLSTKAMERLIEDRVQNSVKLDSSGRD